MFWDWNYENVFEFVYYDDKYIEYRNRMFLTIQYASMVAQADGSDIIDYAQLMNGQAAGINATVVGRVLSAVWKWIAQDVYINDNETTVDDFVASFMAWLEQIMSSAAKRTKWYDLLISMWYNIKDDWLTFASLLNAFSEVWAWFARSQTDKFVVNGWSFWIPYADQHIIEKLSPFNDKQMSEFFKLKKEDQFENLINSMKLDTFLAGSDWKITNWSFWYWFGQNFPILKTISIQWYDNKWQKLQSRLAEILETDIELSDAITKRGIRFSKFEEANNAYSIITELWSHRWNKYESTGLYAALDTYPLLEEKEKFFVKELLDDMKDWWAKIIDLINSETDPKQKTLMRTLAFLDSVTPWAWAIVLADAFYKERWNKVSDMAANSWHPSTFAWYSTDKVNYLKAYRKEEYENAMINMASKYATAVATVDKETYWNLVAKKMYDKYPDLAPLMVTDEKDKQYKNTWFKAPFEWIFNMEMFTRMKLAQWDVNATQMHNAFNAFAMPTYRDIATPEAKALSFKSMQVNLARQHHIIEQANIPQADKDYMKFGIAHAAAQWWLDFLKDKQVMQVVWEDVMNQYKSFVWWSFQKLKDTDSEFNRQEDTDASWNATFKKSTARYTKYNSSKWYYSSYYGNTNYKQFNYIKDEFYNFVYKSLPYFYTKNLYIDKSIGKPFTYSKKEYDYYKGRTLPSGSMNPMVILTKWQSSYVKSKKWRGFGLKRMPGWMTRKSWGRTAEPVGKPIWKQST